MTKKKPDFLRDLDTAIMDELTAGGIKGNAAGLVGTLTCKTKRRIRRGNSSNCRGCSTKSVRAFWNRQQDFNNRKGADH